MKLDATMLQIIQKRIQPREIIFITLSKLYFYHGRQQWTQNCNGFFILYKYEKSYFFTIIEIKTLHIQFDMEIFTNFINFCKFNGQQKCMFFIIPDLSQSIKVLLALQTKAQLLQLKQHLQIVYNVNNSEDGEMSFFKRPQVHEIIVKAQIDERLLDNDLLFKQQVQDQVKRYLKTLQNFENKKAKSGFKVYGLGRQQWAIKQDEKLFLKQKNQIQALDNLKHLQKQAKIRNMGS